MIILIDGQSGAGKTTLAATLSQITGFPVVHLDDIYPGWTGLAAASDMVVRDVLHPTHPGYVSWDWENDRPGQWVSLRGGNMIVEGTGAITEASKSAALALGQLITLRITGPENVRKKRALARDPYYAPFWEMWAEQEERHFAAGVEVDYEIVLDSGGAAGRPVVSKIA
ncbi:hypothetical protein CDES_05225 [Corynebacterium deserti GIMN1.010]|uniref:(d)CMP kinase n=1 Tax=Corynebacterium deserti GIMN1.010 TaxID=931089 RepID=A0A0M4CX67_9CORY|nr:hypothetical protein [Corynebacterium deserti]ALC05482.1 hypothetical protein CDES_05225 [Corynebacterium deserti GIMN1.010]